MILTYATACLNWKSDFANCAMHQLQATTLPDACPAAGFDANAATNGLAEDSESAQ